MTFIQAIEKDDLSMEIKFDAVFGERSDEEVLKLIIHSLCWECRVKLQLLSDVMPILRVTDSEAICKGGEDFRGVMSLVWA